MSIAAMLKGKKPKGDIDPDYKKAKLGVLDELKGMAGSSIGDMLKGSAKKVTVAAPDAEGLAKGLDMAKEVVGDKSAVDDAGGDKQEYDVEEKKQELDELCDDCSPEDLDQLIAHLQMKRDALSNPDDLKA